LACTDAIRYPDNGQFSEAACRLGKRRRTGDAKPRRAGAPRPIGENRRMTQDTVDRAVQGMPAAAAPKIGFVSLGCPKALADSELILTQLRAEGYETSKTFAGADLVIVNTCGFIDDAVKESLDTIGEALAENGKVIVTGCLGAKKAEGEDGGTLVEQIHPSVLAVTGPHATREVMEAVHRHSPKPHDPFVDLVPPQGVKLTPTHYAYLKISEGCNHRCTFCIIPSMRGDLVSRPIGDVLGEAQRLFESGVKELLVISQDTSAYGVDLKFRTGFWDGRPVKTHLTDLSAKLGELAARHGAWVRLHYVYPYPHVDAILPLMAEGAILPYLDVPFQHSHPDVLKRMKRPADGEKNLERLQRWREVCPQLVVRSTFIAGFPGETEAEFEHLLDFMREARIDRAGCFAYSPVEGASANDLPGMLPPGLREERRARFMAAAEEISATKLRERVGATMQVLVDSAPALGRKGGVGRSYADAPEIDGCVRLLPPQKASRTLKVGEFVRARILAAEGHDLVAQPL
jgi:ribosomal protein S12 methylthiotransferase